MNDRESPWVTLLTGTWRARPGLLDVLPDHLIRSKIRAVHEDPRPSDGLFALLVGGELIQVDPAPSRFVVSIRVSKASQVGDANVRPPAQRTVGDRRP